MRKTFPLHVEGKHPDRVVDAIKHEIRKYLKRERRRDLPAGVDYWDFDCKFGLNANEAQSVHVANLIACIDNAVQAKALSFYVEILAAHGVRAKRPASESYASDAPGSDVAA